MNILLILLAFLIFVIAFMLMRTFRLSKYPDPVSSVEKTDIDQKTVSVHLSQLIQFKSISIESAAAFDPQPFLDIHKWIGKTYPSLSDKLEKPASIRAVCYIPGRVRIQNYCRYF